MRDLTYCTNMDLLRNCLMEDQDPDQLGALVALVEKVKRLERKLEKLENKVDLQRAEESPRPDAIQTRMHLIGQCVNGILSNPDLADTNMIPTDFIVSTSIEIANRVFQSYVYPPEG